MRFVKSIFNLLFFVIKTVYWRKLLHGVFWRKKLDHGNKFGHGARFWFLPIGERDDPYKVHVGFT